MIGKNKRLSLDESLIIALWPLIKTHRKSLKPTNGILPAMIIETFFFASIGIEYEDNHEDSLAELKLLQIADIEDLMSVSYTHLRAHET